MRVTHVITRLIVGGAQENTVASVLGLRRKENLEADLISGPTCGAEGSLESEFSGLPGIPTVLPNLVRPIHPWKDLLALRALTRTFRERKPHLVHTHSGKAGILGRLAAKKASVPLIVHTIHGPSFGSFQGSLANTLFLAAERHAARSTTHYVSVADAMSRQYLAAGLGRPGQFTRIWSGFPVEPFLAAGNDPALRSRWGLAPTDFVVGTIARLCPLKGHDDLFAAAPALLRRSPQTKLLLIGDGPWRGRFEAQVRAIGLQRNVVFTGLVSPVEMPRTIGILDAVVHLSRREGLPRALPQALGARKPVVAYDCDGAGEICLQNETGFLVRPGDLGELVERLAQLSGDPALRERLGARGQQIVRERFPVERMVDDLHRLYLKLAASAAVHAPSLTPHDRP